MNEIVAFVLGLLPSIIVGAIAFYLQRAQKKRDVRLERRIEVRRKESALSLEMTTAAAKLSYACAQAIKRGSPSEEIDEAMGVYHKAKEAYYRFMNEQAAEYLE